MSQLLPTTSKRNNEEEEYDNTLKMCEDCKGRTLMENTASNNKPKVEKTKKRITTAITPMMFNSLMKKQLRILVRQKSSIDQIKHNLLRQFPDYEQYITDTVIISFLKAEYKLYSIHRKRPSIINNDIKIENDHSIFVGEANIVLKSIDSVTIHTFIMCAISSKGLYKLDIGIGARQCGQKFIKEILKKLERKHQQQQTYQIVVKSSMPDIHEIERLFGRYSFHTLFYYPIATSTASATHPVRKYIRKLAEHIPKNIRISNFEQVENIFKEAEQKITKKDCKRWIDRYLQYT